MKEPRGTWQRERRTRRRKGVREGERRILEERVAGMVAGGGGGGGGAGLVVEGVGVGRPRAVRMSGWALGFGGVFGFFDEGGVEECGAVFRFWLWGCICPFDFPRAVRLCWSNCTRLDLPSAIASPRVMQSFNCWAVMCWIAGLAIRSVQGMGVAPVVEVEVELPMTASRIMRAKQWSKCTGHWGWEGALERARDGRVCL